MQEINAWLLNDHDFYKGAELYEKYGANSFFKKLLTSAGPTPYNVSKLRAELEKLAPASPATEEIKPTEAVTLPVTTQQPATAETAEKAAPNQKDHARYLFLLQRRNDIVMQLDRNMAILDLSNDKNVLFQTAKQVLRLHQQKEEIWSLIDYYQEHGTFEIIPEPEKPSREKEMQQIYVSLSKARKRLADPEYKDRAKTEKLIADKLRRLEELKGGEE
ncbi:hypothetical protein BDE36_1780 [Arcticibacter tournemirensis]|uniref:Uncharacterized protein n=1 Tax=Arcticibacter tournemirensis TaxID=699437 RepID=A0A5M9H9Z3_9SPHI|nr:hypothetical protein [Arcticibacter tournemirensis]KAA8483756.1 hypothetical protein F1649_07660 [Arcticibacter tournemirensis]TQM50045.1 hypothetical protein BDE36_1780 [Arcticibacter tournemirensis]